MYSFSKNSQIKCFRWYGYFFLFCYVELVPKICPKLSVTPYVYILWSIDPLLGSDLETDYEYSRCYVIGGADTQTLILRQLLGKRVPVATVEVSLGYNNENGVFSVVRGWML
jgi:hypothetical protein